MVGGVGDKEVAGGIGGAGAGRIQLCEARRAVVAGAASGAVAGGRLQRAAGRQAQDAVVAGVHDVQIAGAVGAHGARSAQLRHERRRAFGAGAAGAGARDGADGARRGDQQDAMIVGVRHQHVARGIHGDTHGSVERDVAGGASIGGAPPRGSGAGQRGHGAVPQHLADALGAAVGDEEVAGGIQGQRRGLKELGQRGGSAIADGMHVAITRHGDDVARRIHAPHPHTVGDQEVAVDVGGQVVHGSERGTGGAPAVAGKAGHSGAGVADPLAGGSEGAHHESGVAHVEGSRRVHGHRQRSVQGCARIAAEDGTDGAVGVQFADHVVARIGEIERLRRGRTPCPPGS